MNYVIYRRIGFYGMEGDICRYVLLFSGIGLITYIKAINVGFICNGLIYLCGLK